MPAFKRFLVLLVALNRRNTPKLAKHRRRYTLHLTSQVNERPQSSNDRGCNRNVVKKVRRGLITLHSPAPV
jgi:hypothetical protein